MIILNTKRLKPKLIVKGKVIKGAGDGKKLGFPTVNLDIQEGFELIPGVYACLVDVEGKKVQGALHYGPRLVFDETINQFEIHLLDFSREIYGLELEVYVYEFIRPTKNFISIELLVDQIEEDIIKVRDFFYLIR